jgi:glycerol-3-phosphate dehydrogenase (NAD+)
MWVYEEMIEGRKLTEIINVDHENVKYLPGVQLPDNVVAFPDLLDAARDADLLVFVIPHQFIARLVGQMKGNIKADAAAISLIKGINITGKNLK